MLLRLLLLALTLVLVSAGLRPTLAEQGSDPLWERYQSLQSLDAGLLYAEQLFQRTEMDHVYFGHWGWGSWSDTERGADGASLILKRYVLLAADPEAVSTARARLREAGADEIFLQLLDDATKWRDASQAWHQEQRLAEFQSLLERNSKSAFALADLVGPQGFETRSSAEKARSRSAWAAMGPQFTLWTLSSAYLDGSGQAALELGRRFAEGDGFIQDDILAFFWTAKAQQRIPSFEIAKRVTALGSVLWPWEALAARRLVLQRHSYDAMKPPDVWELVAIQLENLFNLHSLLW